MADRRASCECDLRVKSSKPRAGLGERTATVPHLSLAFHLENHVANEQSELYEAVAASKGVRVKFFDDSETPELAAAERASVNIWSKTNGCCEPRVCQ